MKILGIDPGSRVTGYGLVEHQGNSTRYLDSGCIRLPDKWKLADKLVQISNELGALIENNRPDCASIEQIFFAHNARSGVMSKKNLFDGSTVRTVILNQCSKLIGDLYQFIRKFPFVWQAYATAVQITGRISLMLYQSITGNPTARIDA